MNRMIGFLESYLLGFPPSMTPPWGVARSAAAEEDAAAAAVMVLVTMEAATEDMIAVCRLLACGVAVAAAVAQLCL